jgi:hypothetical protein
MHFVRSTAPERLQKLRRVTAVPFHSRLRVHTDEVGIIR